MPSEPQIPAVADLIPVDQAAEQEQSQFEQKGKRLDLSLRKWAGYGSLGAAVILYVTGTCLAVRFAYTAGAQAPSWHTIIAILIALFTVPTVLVLAVLRSTSILTKDAEADSLHAVIGTKVMNVIDRVLDKLVDTVSSK